MKIFSFSTFGVARVLMALAVFFCHVFPTFNNFGFLFVGVFFFMSGFGMEVGSRRLFALTRLVPYLGLFASFTLLYYVLFGVFPYPTSWYFLVYFSVMVIYRFVRNIYLLLVSFLAFAVVLLGLGFNWVWVASFGAFLFGVFFARNQDAFNLGNCLTLFPLSFLVFLHCPVALWAVLPLFTWVVLRISSLERMRCIAFLGQYTLLFYCSHCLFLGLFDATWTLGGSPSLLPVVLSFCLTCCFSWIMKDGIVRW